MVVIQQEDAEQNAGCIIHMICKNKEKAFWEERLINEKFEKKEDNFIMEVTRCKNNTDNMDSAYQLTRVLAMVVEQKFDVEIELENLSDRKIMWEQYAEDDKEMKLTIGASVIILLPNEIINLMVSYLGKESYKTKPIRCGTCTWFNPAGPIQCYRCKNRICIICHEGKRRPVSEKTKLCDFHEGEEKEDKVRILKSRDDLYIRTRRFNSDTTKSMDDIDVGTSNGINLWDELRNY